MADTNTTRLADLNDVIDLAFAVEDLGFTEEDSFLLAGLALTGSKTGATLMDIRREGRATSRQVIEAHRVLRAALREAVIEDVHNGLDPLVARRILA